MGQTPLKQVRGRVLLTIVVAPAIVVFYTGFTGRSIPDAFANAIGYIISSHGAIAAWSVILVTTIISAIYLSPVFRFVHNRQDAERALHAINGMPRLISLMSVGGFLVGSVAEALVGSDTTILAPRMIGVVAEAVSAGFFTAMIITLNLDIMLFPVKREIVAAAPEIRQCRRSFYHLLMRTIFAMLFFLAVQLAENSAAFVAVGVQNPAMPGGIDFSDGPRMLEMSRDVLGLRPMFNVLLVRTALFFLMAMELIGMIKRQIRDPLRTIHAHLADLNTKDAANVESIDIVNNDEFSEVYREINRLIERQQQELTRSRKRLDVIIRNAADAIIVFDPDGTITLFNPAAERLFGRSEQEMLGASVGSHLRPRYSEDAAAEVTSDIIAELQRRDESGRPKRMQVVAAGGELIPVETNTSATEDAAGAFYTVILRDIRSQLEYERTLQEARTAAETANRMKSEFLANMSHELRTPLNAILGYTQLMADDRNLTDTQREKVRTISNSGEHLLGLINDILDISKIEAGKFEVNEEVFDLRSFVDDLKDMFQIRCDQKGLSLYVEYVGDLPTYVTGDLGKLRQVMINLLGNAVKFTAEGGIGVIVGLDEDRVRFAVTDTGKGIPVDDQAEILKPFVQSSVTDHEGGTGLGLAISSRFVEMMGGALELESAVGSGSTFSFSLPLRTSESAPEPVRDPGTVRAVADGSHPRVLVVDDKTDNRIILKDMLERVGFVVMEAADGRQAVERAREHLPQMIFMDIKMPVMDGYEAVGLLKDDPGTRDIIVFALTASAFRHDEQRIRESGFDGFLAKPFQQKRLFELIESNSPVRFEYEAPAADDPSSPPSMLDDEQIRSAGATIAAADLHQLEDALAINDFARITRWADEHERDLTRALTGLVRSFASSFNEEALQRLVSMLTDRREGE